jgi:hypothetical protein
MAFRLFINAIIQANSYFIGPNAALVHQTVYETSFKGGNSDLGIVPYDLGGCGAKAGGQ